MSDLILTQGNNELNISLIPIVGVEVSRITFNGTGGNLVDGFYECLSRLTKREYGSAPNEPQQFSFGITFRNKLNYEVWLDVYFALGLWNGIFTPYSPQGNLIAAYYPEGGIDTKSYAVKNNYMWLGANPEYYYTGRNMTEFYGKGYFLVVPSGGEAETGLDGVYINKHARSIYPPNYSVEPLLALYFKTLQDGEVINEGYNTRNVREPLPPLDLDIGVYAHVYRYEEVVGPKGTAARLVDTGLEVVGGLLNATHITNAWGSWSKAADWPGRTIHYKWEWVRYIEPQVFEPCPAPAWWVE